MVDLDRVRRIGASLPARLDLGVSRQLVVFVAGTTMPGNFGDSPASSHVGVEGHLDWTARDAPGGLGSYWGDNHGLKEQFAELLQS